MTESLPIVIERVMSRVTETPGPLGTPCWVCASSVSTKGYARIQVNGREFKCHRVTYEHFVGPIPEGLQIDHLCRVRNCVNPAHLEPVTSRENTLRGNSLTAISVRTNTCKRGHSLEDALREPTGSRRCRTCNRDRRRRERARDRNIQATP